MTRFFKFPSTPHLISHKGLTRKDKVLSQSDLQKFLRNRLVIEEKIDGANIGISSDIDGTIQVQNRGNILGVPYSGQFSRLSSWLAVNALQLQPALEQDIILFGEWCAAKHSIEYTSLPDFFILFDVYDFAEQAFWSVRRRDELASSLKLQVPHNLGCWPSNAEALQNLINETKSAYSNSAIEGIILRYDSDLWNLQRAKAVRSDFTQSIQEHWSKQAMSWNRTRD